MWGKGWKSYGRVLDDRKTAEGMYVRFPGKVSCALPLLSGLFGYHMPSSIKPASRNKTTPILEALIALIVKIWRVKL
jgi:hypothetical protein